MWIEEREAEGGDRERRSEREGENQKHKQVKSSLIMLFSSPPVPTARPNVGNMRILVGTKVQMTHAESSKPTLEKTCRSFQKGVEQRFLACSCGLWPQQTMQASSIQSGDCQGALERP